MNVTCESFIVGLPSLTCTVLKIFIWDSFKTFHIENVLFKLTECSACRNCVLKCFRIEKSLLNQSFQFAVNEDADSYATYKVKKFFYKSDIGFSRLYCFKLAGHFYCG